MPRLLFTCAYDGAPYLGWQSQRGGNTVQDIIENAFAAILKAPMRIAAAGRTDAGVHAFGQSFHADIPGDCRMDGRAWCAALNTHLPAAIRILGAREVAADFHARFNASGKLYEYTICTAPVLPPFLAGRAWHMPRPFDDTLLAQALKQYEGTHDFRRFAARRGNEPDIPPPGFYQRSLWSAAMQREGESVRLRFHGNGFMYRMVRLLTGSAMQVALGRMPLAELAGMLNSGQGATTRHCAPAGGLALVRVEYGDNGVQGALPPPLRSCPSLPVIPLPPSAEKLES